MAFLATAYGPPWNSMEGSGVTSTGVNLRAGRQLPVIAVDPSLIPYGSIVRVSNSPFGRNKLFVAADTGGAIRGQHIDFFVASGRQAQNGWGARQIGLQVVQRGSGPGSVSSALRKVTSGQGGYSTSSAGSTPVQQGQGPPTTFKSPVLDQAGFQDAQRRYLTGNFLSQTAKTNPWGTTGGSSGLGSLFAAGALTTTPPNVQDFQHSQTFKLAQSSLQRMAGGNVLTAHPNARQQTMKASGLAGGFLPAGAKYAANRRDQGRDGATNPGGPIIAPGNGYVVRIGSDPGGFGPRYPIIHFTSGPYAGRTMYLGHTLAVVTHGSFRAGQVLSRTGTSGVGNATVPGWFEIGYADGGTPGPFGQPVPF